MYWWGKEPGHQQPLYGSSSPFHSTHLLLSCEAISANDTSHLLTLFDLWEFGHHPVERRHFHVEDLVEMLMVAAELEVGVAPDQTISWGKL